MSTCRENVTVTKTHFKDEGSGNVSVKDRGSPQRLLQPDVDDDADRPHVQRAVVALVPEHLRRQVRRRADHRAPERLLADDPGEAEVTELHLQREDDRRFKFHNVPSHVGRFTERLLFIDVSLFLSRIMSNPLNRFLRNLGRVGHGPVGR